VLIPTNEDSRSGGRCQGCDATPGQLRSAHFLVIDGEDGGSGQAFGKVMEPEFQMLMVD